VDVDTHDDLYHGATTLAVTRGVNAERQIDMRSSHIHMVVEVAGYAGTRAAGDAPVSIEHTNLPAWTDFENRHASDERLSHLPRHNVRDGAWVFDYSVMRNLDGSSIVVRNAAGETIHTVDVGQFLADHPEVDHTLQEALVAIRIEFRSLEVVVTIPEWALEGASPEF
jgi:hypothetical protein